MNALSTPALPDRRTRVRRWGTRVALGGALLASLAGAAAFRTLFARPGEAALRYVPANAMVVATLDLSPSATQAIAFKRIDDALARNGMANMLEGSLIDLFEPQAKGREALRPLVLRHGAVAMLPKAGAKFGEGDAVAMLAVSSGSDAQRALEREGEARYFRGAKYFKLRKGNMLYMVVDDLLVVSDKPEALFAIKQTRDGAPNITSVASFTSSRALVADDANLMFFVSPRFIKDGPKGTEGLMADWMTVGMSIRDGGLGLSFAGATDPKKEPAFAGLGEVAPIRNDLFRVLPSGMYGAMVYSQPTKAFEAMEKGVVKDADMKKGVREMEDSLRKEVGMDFRKDILPAFKGTTILAAYPTAAPAAGVDALLVIDDLHGADPANAIDRFTHWVEDQMEKEGQTQELFTRSEKDGVTYFRMAKQGEDEIRESLMGDGPDNDVVRKDVLVGSKTIAWAVVGKSVLASTNQALLDRAVASYRSNLDPMTTDARFAGVEREVVDGSQSVAMFSLARIAEGIKGTMRMDKLGKDDRKTWGNILGAFETLEQPFTAKMRMMPNGRFAGGTFIPLDYDKMLNFAGDLKKDMEKK